MPNATTYDPTSSTPYTAPVLPEPPAPPEIAPAVEPGFQPRGMTNRGGGIAATIDNAFRGYMRGRAMGEATKAMKLKRQSDQYQAAYGLAAQNLKSLHDSGADPNSKEYQDAVAAVHGSWNAWAQFVGTHVVPQDATKKRGKGKSKDQAQNPLAQIASQDPNEKVQGLYAVMTKLGPPVLRQLDTPQQMGARKRDAETAELEAQHKANLAKAQVRQDELEAKKRGGTISPEEEKELASYTQKPEDEAHQAYLAVMQKKLKNPDYEFSNSDIATIKAVTGHDISPKAQVVRSKTGEVGVVERGEDGTMEYTKLHGPTGGTGGGTKVKPIPPATAGTWSTAKDNAIAEARTLFVHGDSKGNKISPDEYLNLWQQAQDAYEAKYASAGHPIPHINIREHVNTDPKSPQFGQWIGSSSGGHGTAVAGGKLKAYQNGKLVDDTEYTQEEVSAIMADPQSKSLGLEFK